MRCAEKVAWAYKLGHKAGYEEGLDAAREAVVALCWRKQYEGFVSTVDPLRVLAAIDALLENRETPPPLPPSVGVPERRWT